MIKYLAVALAATLSLSAAQAAPTIVNLNASATNPNAGNNSSGFTYNPVTVSLTAGTYSVSVIGKSSGGLYDGYSVYAPAPGNFAYTDGNWSVLANGVTQTQGSPQRFDTVAAALAYYSTLPALTFTLTTTSLVSFFVDDTAYPYFADDAGGVSLFVQNLGSSVPEPATWAMMIVGFGTVGAAMRRRPRTTVSYA